MPHKLFIVLLTLNLFLTVACQKSSEGVQSPAAQTPVSVLGEGYTEVPTNYDQMELEKLSADMVLFFKADQTLLGTLYKKTDKEPLNELNIDLFQTDIVLKVHTKSCFLTLKSESDRASSSFTFKTGDKLVIKNTLRWGGGNGMNNVINFEPFASFSEAFMVCTDYFYNLGREDIPQSMTLGDVRNGMKNLVSFASKK